MSAEPSGAEVGGESLQDAIVKFEHALDGLRQGGREGAVVGHGSETAAPALNRSVTLVEDGLAELRRLAFGSDADAEGHSSSRWSDKRLELCIVEVEGALGTLRALAPPEGEDTEGHYFRGWSDERLKEAVVEVEEAIASLRALGTHAAEDEDTEGHGYRWSDERLKKAVAPVEQPVASLRALVEGYVRRSRPAPSRV